MRIHLLCVGRRMPAWVEAGYAEYARRLSGECSLNLVEIEPGHRGKGASPEPARREEGERLLKALPKGALVIALDERGESWDTARLATELSGWLAGGREPALLVGGADGLTAECLQRARAALVAVGPDLPPSPGPGDPGRADLPRLDPGQGPPLPPCLSPG